MTHPKKPQNQNQKPTDDEVDGNDPTRKRTPVQAIPVTDTYDPEKDLLAARNYKATVLGHLSQNGVPTNSKDLGMALQVVDSIDRSALAAMRLKMETDAAANQAEVNKALIQQFINQRPPNPFVGMPVDANRETPTLPDSVVTRDFVEGESHQGTIHQTIDTFSAKNGPVELFTGDPSTLKDD